MMDSNQPVTNIEEKRESDKLQVFYHHIYEFKKGVRNLILHTEKASLRSKIEKRLEKENISFVIHQINKDKINIYFGNEDCIEVVKTFNTSLLNEITPEQDFMLGIMLGYDRLKQCKRYLYRNNLLKKDSINEKEVLTGSVFW